jgi:hypothetical protein
LNWTQLPGTAKEVAAGYRYRIWKVESGSGDQGISYWDVGKSSVWINASQARSGVRIESDTSGNVWLVNSVGEAWKGNSTGGSWTQYNTLATGGTTTIVDIGAGGTQIWAVGGTYDVNSGYQVFHLVSGKWVLDGTARGMRVTVDRLGNPWMIDLQNDVYQLTGGACVQRGTVKAYGIGAGLDGQVWISEALGSSRIYKWTGSAWDLCDNGQATELDQSFGFTATVNPSNQIWVGKP